MKFAVVRIQENCSITCIGVFETLTEAEKVVKNCLEHFSGVQIIEINVGLNPEYLKYTLNDYLPTFNTPPINYSKFCVELDYTNEYLKRYTSNKLEKIGELFNQGSYVRFPVKVVGKETSKYFKEKYPQFANDYNNIMSSSPFTWGLLFEVTD